MKTAIATRNWYKRDWRILRNQLIQLSLTYSKIILQGIAGNNIPVEVFLKQIREDIAERIAGDQLGLWQNALPLLIDPDWLQRELERDITALSGKKRDKGEYISPKQALARKLILFFERNRREHLASEQGVSSHRVKTWERLDKISRVLAREQSYTTRCVEEHFAALADYIKSNYSHDKNLPRRAEKVMEYFYQFNDECLEHIQDYDSIQDNLSIQEAQELLHGIGRAELEACLGELSAEERKFIEVRFHLGLSDAVSHCPDDYMQNLEMEKSLLEEKQADVLVMLRRCLELRLAARQGGWR